MTKEIGMLDVGTHCYYCRQLDFLPFHCSQCNHDFCSSHRLKESHHCESLQLNIPNDSQKSTSSIVNNHGKFFQSLLPAKASERIKESTRSPSPSSSRQYNTTLKSSLNKSSLDKLLKFFNRHKTKISSTSSSSNKISQKLSLQKLSKGDTKIPLQNRIYIYCYVLDTDRDIDEPNPIYINKIWPIGRVIDYLASQLDIKNVNLKADPNMKLFLYKALQSGNNQQLVELNPNDRVIDKIFTLDTLYLIRGEIKK